MYHLTWPPFSPQPWIEHDEVPDMTAQKVYFRQCWDNLKRRQFLSKTRGFLVNSAMKTNDKTHMWIKYQNVDILYTVDIFEI